MVAKSEPGKPLLTEDTRTLIVSAHGALFVLQMAVQLGELLILKHKKSQEELVCRVVNFTPEQSGKFEVGVEFEHPSPKFWRIAFPPSDWSPRSADAKLPTAQPVSARTPVRKLGVVASDSTINRQDRWGRLQQRFLAVVSFSLRPHAFSDPFTAPAIPCYS